ncbi:hypothetical protein [Cypionkella psychrotolerans]|uniref:hypothetical protein n=1 Tax=Cypionkella psychrotolerans TaxID=1678131 RepID=UPI00138F94F6|nr:hypothetical protein [Cypionkella psychrotolerans]
MAHSFTAALIVAGDNREASLAEAVRGFLLAADERDGHSNETSDGHLGGVDVHVLPLTQDASGLVEGLIGTPTEPADVVVVLGPESAASEAAREYLSTSTVLLQVVLLVGWDSDEGTDSFVALPSRLWHSARLDGGNRLSRSASSGCRHQTAGRCDPAGGSGRRLAITRSWAALVILKFSEIAVCTGPLRVGAFGATLLA